jgi:hypothetical protein
MGKQILLWITLVTLALVAFAAAMTLGQPSNEGSGSSMSEPERDRFVAEIQAQLEVWSREMADLRSRAELQSEIDLSQEIAQLEAMIADAEQNLAELEMGAADAWDAARMRLEEAMVEINDFFDQLGDRLRSA